MTNQANLQVLSLGIPLFNTHNPLPSTTLSPAPGEWDPKRLFYHTTRISASIARHELYALQVGDAWARTIPVLALAPDALLLGFGSVVRVHPLHAADFAHRRVGEPVAVDVSAGDIAKRSGAGSGADIVGIHALPAPSGTDFVVAQFDGSVQRYTRGRSAAHYPHPGGVHSLTGWREMVLSVSGAGGSASISGSRRTASAFSSAASTPGSANVPSARLFSATSPWIPPSELTLPGRAWSAHLSSRGAFFGLRGGIHRHDASSGLSDQGDIFLPVSEEVSRSAAYGLATFPTTSGSPLASTLLSAWHDGTARVHDLRTRRQVMALTDPWSDSALFSAAFVGPHGVIAGGAEHGIVNVWDVRYATAHTGWSVFSPHGRGSPVYDLAGDGGRVWGVTERRAFVLAFDDAEVGCPGDPGGELRRRGSATKEVPTGWRPRGGRVGWTVHYGEHALKETVMGYRHGEGGMSLFESRVR